MPSSLSIEQLGSYKKRIVAGELEEAIKIYSELYSLGYNYAGWARGIATGATITGVAALDFLSASALLGIGGAECKYLPPEKIDRIRLNMAEGYVSALIDIAQSSGGKVSRDVSFRETSNFHSQAFLGNGLTINNWTLNVPMSLLGKTLGDAAVEKIWQELRDTGGSGVSSLLATTWLATRVGQLAFSTDSTIAAAAQAWIDMMPGFANLSQVQSAVSALVTSYTGWTSPSLMNADDLGKIIDVVSSLTVVSNTSSGTTVQASVRNPTSGAVSNLTVVTRPITSGDMAGGTLVDTTNALTGQTTYQLRSADGTLAQGNVAANGSISFMVDRTMYVFRSGTCVGAFDPFAGTGSLSNGSSGHYAYDATTGLITRDSSTVGQNTVGGFSYTQTSRDGLIWSAPTYAFSDTNAATTADHVAWEALANGEIDRATFENLVNSSTDYLINHDTVTYTPGTNSSVYDPIGAFYESRSAALDNAASIASKTFRVMIGGSTPASAAFLQAMDINGDGKLSGTELSGLTAWSDLNEDGALNTTGVNGNELTTLAAALAAAGLTSLRASDYEFHTSGNARYTLSGQSATSAPAPNRVAPSLPLDLSYSNYTLLRLTDNRFYTDATHWIDWAANQVKVSSDVKNLVGTDGNDVFDINYYAAYDGRYFNLSTIQNFYAGGGNDIMGGSSRSDILWGGTGNDTLYGYTGDDRLYGETGDDHMEAGAGNDFLDGGIGNDLLFGEAGNDTLSGADGADELQGGDGSDLLDGGFGNDKLFGQAGNDTMNGGDGDDLMLGFTPSNDARQTLAAGETDDDTMFGGAGHDEMYGGLGNDYLDGGLGDDLVVGDEGSDTLFGGAGNDELDGGNGADLLDGGLGNDKLFGSAGNDQLWGGDGDDILLGFTPTNSSKQTLAGGETDDDMMWGGAGNDLMLGGLGGDRLWGGIGNDELDGGDGNDALYGEAGNDRLFGGAGDDVIYGGDGDDLILGFTASNDARQALAAGETDNNFLYGGAGNDTIIGGLGNDYIDGGAGADEMEGGQGNDTYVVNSVNDVILEQAGEGYDSVTSSANYILNANIEELRLVEGYTINGTGNSLDNRLIGNSRDNILDGVTGADTMMGGLGNDTYYVDNAGDRVIESALEGTDTVNSNISYALGANVENLTLLDFSKPEKGMADGTPILVYGYPKANELDYMQGNAVAGYAGTCALTSIANLATQANQQLSEAQVVQRAIDNSWCVTDPAKPDYQRGGSNYVQQQALLTSYGIDNGIIHGYNEQAIANLVKGGRGVLIGLNAGKLWGESSYLDNGGVNHVVTVTGAAFDETSGALNGFYIADSGRGLVSDMTRYIPIADFRSDANVANAYTLYTVDPIKLWEENIDATGNELDNVIAGNRGNNVLSGGRGKDTLIGQAGNDTYVFARGDGQDTLIDKDTAAGNRDVLRLDGIDQTNLWFRHAGNDLQISIMGTSDQITVKDWYVPGVTGSDNRIEAIRTADGRTMYDSDVEQFVQAMAAFAPPSAGQTSWRNGMSSNGQILVAVAH